MRFCPIVARNAMTARHHALTDKEKQTLRLLLAGHDAKSMSRHLGLSVHTINERLRESRRKLSASSSREAARLLHEAERADPQSFADIELGAATALPGAARTGASIARMPIRHRAVWIIGVIVMLSLALVALALSPAASPPTNAPPAVSTAPEPAETAVAQSARRWLVLVDASDWQASWLATATSFRNLNTIDRWASASQVARVPLGVAQARTLIGEDDVPTPPKGNMIVKFRTRFAAKAEATETLALVREDGDWRVVGYYID